MLLECKSCKKVFNSYNGLCKFCSSYCAIIDKLEVNLSTPILNGKHCSEWTGVKNIGGYGQITYRGKTIKTHREVYKQYFNIGKNDVVMHMCDNVLCNEIRHLKHGTQKENIHDMIIKNRKTIQRGEQSSKTKLTEKQAIDIKYNNKEKTNIELSKIYNVTPTAISMIRLGKNWKHI